MTSLVLGVIGHVDHGKTALVRALTGEDTDRLPEEKRRGISIALGFARLKAGPGLEMDLVDMPGHERFVRTMVAGATGIDAALLVVAANEGVKPQTVEHVDIAGLLGLRRAVVAVSKTDLVPPEAARAVGDEAVRLLRRSGLEAPAPIMTSAHEGAGIEALGEALASLAASLGPHPADGLAYLPVDRAFSVAGHGPVVTGALRGAAVAMGETLELLPSGKRVRVRAVQVRGVRVAQAMPGQRVALNLRDVEMAELARGVALAAPGALALSDWLTISIRAVEAAAPLRNGARLRALLGTDELDARLRLLDRDVLEPGEAGLAQLRFDVPVAIPAGEHLVLRIASPALTVAGGRVLEPAARRLRRGSPQVLRRLEDLRDLPPAAMLAAEAARAGTAGVTVERLSQLSALAPPKVVELLQAQPVVVTRAGLVTPRADMERLLARIPVLLAPHAGGLSRDKLLQELPGTGAAVLDAALGRLLARGLVATRGGQVLVPRPEEDRARARGEAEVASHIADALRRARLTPPDPKEIVTDLSSKRAVDRLLRDGVVVRAVDRAKGKEIIFHRDAIAEAQRRLAPLLEREDGVLVTEVGAELGISRKYSVPLLDYLDTIRFTRRVGDRRTRGAGFSQAR